MTVARVRMRTFTNILVALVATTTIGCESPGSGSESDAALLNDGADGVLDTSSPPVSAPDPQCLSNQCVDSTDCGNGERCNTSLAPPTCNKLYCASVQEPCSEQAHCESDLYCLENQPIAYCADLGCRGSAPRECSAQVQLTITSGGETKVETYEYEWTCPAAECVCVMSGDRSAPDLGCATEAALRAEDCRDAAVGTCACDPCPVGDSCRSTADEDGIHVWCDPGFL